MCHYFIFIGPDDFSAIDETLTFTAEVTKVNVSVMVVNDQIREGEERFTADLQLTTSDDSVLINPPTTTIVILDDDGIQYSNTSILLCYICALYGL